MTDYRWVLCDNKINALNDIMNGLVDLKDSEHRIINLRDCETYDLDGYTLQYLRDFVANEDIKLFKKVVDTVK